MAIKLLEAVRNAILDANKRQHDEVDKIMKEHLDLLNDLEKKYPTDAELEARVLEFMCATGAGPFGMLKALHDTEKKLEADKKIKK